MVIKSIFLYLCVFNFLLTGTITLASSPDDNVYMSDPDASDDTQSDNIDSQQNYNTDTEDNTDNYPYYPYYPGYYSPIIPIAPSTPGYSLPNGFNQSLPHNQGFNAGINHSMSSNFPTLQMKGAISSGNQTTFPTLHPR